MDANLKSDAHRLPGVSSDELFAIRRKESYHFEIRWSALRLHVPNGWETGPAQLPKKATPRRLKRKGAPPGSTLPIQDCLRGYAKQPGVPTSLGRSKAHRSRPGSRPQP